MLQRHTHTLCLSCCERDCHKQSCSKNQNKCADAAFKLKVINFAKGMNNSSAAREFGVNAQTVEQMDDHYHSWKYESSISGYGL